MIRLPPTEDDLRSLLYLDAEDIARPDEFLSRLEHAQRQANRFDRPTCRRGLSPAHIAVAIAVCVAVAMTTILVLARGRSKPPPAAPAGSASAPPTHLSLAPVPYFSMNTDDLRRDREVLKLNYMPNNRNEYEGGTVTLFRPGVFDGAAFKSSATRLTVADHTAYFGTSPSGHEGNFLDDALGWQLNDGQWLVIMGLAYGDHPNSTSIEAAELIIARAIRVE